MNFKKQDKHACNISLAKKKKYWLRGVKLKPENYEGKLY